MLFRNDLVVSGFSLSCLTIRFGIWATTVLSSHGVEGTCLRDLIGNSEWDFFAPNCTVHNLHRLKSDHCPILVSLSPIVQRDCRSFQVLASWMLHAEFKDLVRKTWRNYIGIERNLECFQNVVQDWNK